MPFLDPASLKPETVIKKVMAFAMAGAHEPGKKTVAWAYEKIGYDLLRLCDIGQIMKKHADPETLACAPHVGKNLHYRLFYEAGEAEANRVSAILLRDFPVSISQADFKALIADDDIAQYFIGTAWSPWVLGDKDIKSHLYKDTGYYSDLEHLFKQDFKNIVPPVYGDEPFEDFIARRGIDREDVLALALKFTTGYKKMQTFGFYDDVSAQYLWERKRMISPAFMHQICTDTDSPAAQKLQGRLTQMSLHDRRGLIIMPPANIPVKDQERAHSVGKIFAEADLNNTSRRAGGQDKAPKTPRKTIGNP